jgi:methylglutaconyl-CoA hydratase
VPMAELDNAVERRLAELMSSGPTAISAAKALIREVSGEQPVDVIGLTTHRIAAQRVSPEGQEGMRAFLEKRKANWIPDA